jgi:hypothetical protein
MKDQHRISEVRKVEDSIGSLSIFDAQFLNPSANEGIGRDNGIESLWPFCKSRWLYLIPAEPLRESPSKQHAL